MRTAKIGFLDAKMILVVGAVILGAFVLILAVRLYEIRVENETAALHKEMSPYVSPAQNVTADLRELRSQRFAIEARFDPQIALAGSDTDGIRKALIPLQSEASMILGSYSPEERAKIEPVLYPRVFLSLLPELEDMRRSLIRSPNKEAVVRYNTQLRRTIRAYRDDILLYKQTLASLPALEHSTTLNYLAGTTSVSEIIGKLSALEQRARELDTTREKRYRCFTGESSDCTPLSASFAIFVQAPPVTTSEPPTSLTRSLVYRDIVHASFSEMLGIQETYGVVVKLSRSDCLSGTPAAYYYFFQSREEEGILSSTATPLNDLYFYDLKESIRTQKDPPVYLQALYDAGLRYNFQNIGNLYFCPNGGHVLADTATLVSLHEKLKQAPLFAHRYDEFPELARLEKKFTEASVASEEDMDRYFSAVNDSLRNGGEDALYARIGATKLFEMEEMIHEWRNRSSHFEQSLTAAHHINRLSRGIISRSKAPPYAFLTSRVYASIFFMTFNQSVAGESFLFLDSINSEPPLGNFHLLPFSTGPIGPIDEIRVFDELQNEQKIIDAVLQVER